MTDFEETSRNAYRERLDRLAQERFEKLESMRADGAEPFSSGFTPDTTAAAFFEQYGELSKEELNDVDAEVSVAGRVRFLRDLGKVMFIKIQDRTCEPGLKEGAIRPDDDDDHFLQLFVSKKAVGEENFEAMKALDLGDIIGVSGGVMRTNTKELSVFARDFHLLTKSVRPLPEKFKGLSDVEQRFRQRYVDLIMNPESRAVFRARNQIVRSIRRYLEERDFMEVETPMMHVTPGGAAARPFVTHHNALDMELFLRIAPELYLKRLLVGGFERVFELNKNFRNEGLSRRHNPEFTMLEFYQAYASHEDLMAMTEDLISSLAEELRGRGEDGRIVIETEGQSIDLSGPWRRVSVAGAVADYFDVSEEEVQSRSFLEEKAADRDLDYEAWDDGKLLMEVFEEFVEDTLIQPTFVVDFPASVSPLSRRKDDNPELVDRFELIILGREIANGFAELNDPEDQYLRFAEQLRAKEAGDEEAMPMDEDYVRALEYGMPPAAGEGIGIDRLTMLLTGQDSIREVVLFPHLRPEQSE
jgi:lysyl-tRNA synthetase class 2